MESDREPGSLRLLIVEDDPGTLELLRTLLAHPRVEILCAADGEAALELAWRTKPAAVLLDLSLPKRNGFEVFLELRRASFGPKIVLFTGAMPDVLSLGKGLGAYGCLTKPFGPEIRDLALKALGLDAGAASAPGQAKKRLLIVEDDRDTLAALRDLLEAEDVEVETAQNGIEALKKVGRGRFDAALIDVRLPLLDGIELFSRLRASAVPFPLLVMSAVAGPAVLEHARELGAYAAFEKPFDTDAVERTVRAAMRLPGRTG